MGLAGGRPALAAAVLGLAFAWGGMRDSARERLRLVLLALLVAALFVYPIFAGKYWRYHWLPFQYATTLAASLFFADRARRAPWPVAAVFAVLVGASVPLRVHPMSPWGDLHPDRIREMSGYLRQHLEPGDTVQPLDWTGGAIDAMLQARAPIATPYIYDFVFYHHVDTSYIQQQRQRFLEAFDRARPRFVIEVFMKGTVAGPRTAQTFEDLDTRLHADYRIVYPGDGFVIYERRRFQTGVDVSDARRTVWRRTSAIPSMSRGRSWFPSSTPGPTPFFMRCGRESVNDLRVVDASHAKRSITRGEAGDGGGALIKMREGADEERLNTFRF